MSQPDGATDDDATFWCPFCEGALRTHKRAFDHAHTHVPDKGDTAVVVMDMFDNRAIADVDSAAFLTTDDETDETDDEPSDSSGNDTTPENTGLESADIDANPGGSALDNPVQIRSTGTHIPSALKQRDIWVIWAPEHGKVPLAPWQTGHCYPAAWGANADTDPTTDFDAAKMFADLPPREIHRQYPFPSDDNGDPVVPETVHPTFYLPHDPPDPPIMLVDFDDVIVDGKIPREVADIVERLDAYAEISSSGNGIHMFIRGELPDDLGKFIGDLDTVGHIELYDHGRMVGATWDHLAGTPTTVPERQSEVLNIVAEYETITLALRRLRNRGDAPDARDALASLIDSDDHHATEETRLTDVVDDVDAEIPAPGTPIQGGDSTRNTPPACGGGGGGPRDDVDIGARIARSGGSENAYFQLDIRDVADTGPFRSYRTDGRNPAPGKWDGPHPGHGATSSGKNDVESTNFGVETRDDVWHCFAHDSGGGPLALLAVLEGVVRCGSAQRVYNDGETQLKACLVARDQYPALDDADPPRKVLEAVAEHHEIGDPDDMADDDYRIARKIYDQLEPGDI